MKTIKIYKKTVNGSPYYIKELTWDAVLGNLKRVSVSRRFGTYNKEQFIKGCKKNIASGYERI